MRGTSRCLAQFLSVALAAGGGGACRPAETSTPSPAAQPVPTPPPAPPAPAPPPVAPPPAPRGEVAPILRDLALWDAATSDERKAAAELAAPLLHKFELTGLHVFTCGGASHEIAVFRHGTTGLEFSLIPGGTFEMGAPPSEAGRLAGEESQTVRLTGPYLIARTECTQSAWDLVMGSNSSKHAGADRPVDMVTCYDAEAFCSRARLTLPSEAQWERACRAGTTTAYASGDTATSLAELAWFDDSAGATHPVGTRKPNAFGLFDVHGNVWEWCRDAYGPRTGSEATDPVREAAGADQRVVRGGAFGTAANTLRSAFRYRLHPGEKQGSVGFRPARAVEWVDPGRKRR